MVFANLIESVKATVVIAFIYFLLVLLERFFIYRKIEFEKFGSFILITAVLIIPVALLYIFLVNWLKGTNLALIVVLGAALLVSSIFAFSGLIDYMFKIGGVLKPTFSLKIMYVGFHLTATLFYIILKT